MAFDMHTHTSCSDGTETPREVIMAAARAELAGVAITDHDTTTGWDEALDTARAVGIGLVRGMEVSCATDSGISVHVLSYLQDPEAMGLGEEIARARESRVTRAQRMTELVGKDYPITWDDVQAQRRDGATVGRPHIADALVAVGVVPNRSAAFTEILQSRSRYYVPHYAPHPARVVELIRQAGGVAVFAHPKAEKRGRVVADEVFYEMIDAGLAGVEIRHRDNTAEGKVWLTQLAKDHNLLVTGSSDYHGTGKPNRLGENSTETATVEAIAAAARSSVEVFWG